MNQEKLKGAGLAAGGTAAVILGVIALYYVAKALIPLGGATTQVAKDAGSIAKDVSGGAADLVSGTRDAAGGFLFPTKNTFAPVTLAQISGSHEAGRPQLRITSLTNKNTKTGTFNTGKRNTVRLRVVDPAGRPVSGASIYTIPAHELIRRVNTGWYTEAAGVTDANGWADNITWWTRNLAGTDSEDDAYIVAKKPGYNSSSPILVR